MLRQGINIADVAYYIGEDTPKMTGAQNPLLPMGYQFDYINAEVLLRDVVVKDGLLMLLMEPRIGYWYYPTKKPCVRKYLLK